MLVCGPSCAGPRVDFGPCQDLVAASPGSWQDSLPPVLALGRGAATPLAEALSASPDGPGAQAALCALGELGNRDAVPLLVQWIIEDRPHAYEAALSLGKLGDERVTPTLQKCADDASRDSVTRTAAACALLDLGQVEAATPLLHAVLVAGTPYGGDLGTVHGLPEKSRWALERTLAIDAIARFADGERFGLDADAAWPRLKVGAEAFERYVHDLQQP